jgi:hypothetical protein
MLACPTHPSPYPCSQEESDPQEDSVLVKKMGFRMGKAGVEIPHPSLFSWAILVKYLSPSVLFTSRVK